MLFRTYGEKQKGGPHGPASLSCLCRGELAREDVDDATTACNAELDDAGRQGEQGVVLAAANIVTRVEVSAALAHDDLAGVDGLATEALDAKALRIGVATVSGAGRTLLLCHYYTSRG